jgi:peptide-methionine (S)-S-oxide reductase
MFPSLKQPLSAKNARLGLLAAPLFALGAVTLFGEAARSGDSAISIPPPATASPAAEAKGPQKLVLAGGCFWGVQAVFQHVKGVSAAVSGYSGGPASQANYDAVSGGTTGHAEAVEITYDPQVVSYGKLLQVFFSVAHNPTELDRQGPDVGTQYRSEIFAADDAQAALAKSYIAQLEAGHAFGRKIVTKVEPLKDFSIAEAYHQDYLVRHPNQPYIAYNDMPKIENLKRMFPDLYTSEPKLVASAAGH